MTVAVYRRLWCDTKCGAWYGLAEMPGDTATELRRRAAKEGWRRRDGKDLCPDHAAVSQPGKDETPSCGHSPNHCWGCPGGCASCRCHDEGRAADRA